MLEIRLPPDPLLTHFCSRGWVQTRTVPGAAQAAKGFEWFMTGWKRRKVTLGSKAECLYTTGRKGTENS